MAFLIITSEIIEERVLNDDGTVSYEPARSRNASHLMNGCLETIKSRIGNANTIHLNLDSMDLGDCNQCISNAKDRKLPCNGINGVCCYDATDDFKRVYQTIVSAEAIVWIYTYSKKNSPGIAMQKLINRMVVSSKKATKEDLLHGPSIPMLFIVCAEENDNFRRSVDSFLEILRDIPFQYLVQFVDCFYICTENNVYLRQAVGEAAKVLWENRQNYRYGRFMHTPKGYDPFDWHMEVLRKAHQKKMDEESEPAGLKRETNLHLFNLGDEHQFSKKGLTISPNDVWNWYCEQKSEARLALAFATASNKFWWDESDAYDCESESSRQLETSGDTDSWLRVIQQFENEIITTLNGDDIDPSIMSPQWGQALFMERNGYYNENGWWSHRDKKPDNK